MPLDRGTISPMEFKDYLNGRTKNLVNLLGLRWLSVYELRIVDSKSIAYKISSHGRPPEQDSFLLEEGHRIFGASIMEPCYFQEALLGFVGAETEFEKNDALVEEIKSFASQLSCLLRSQDRTRACLIDSIIEKIHRSHREKYHWTGVYLVGPSGALALEGFRGEPTSHMIIPENSGICGAAIREKKILNVADVHADPRYLSCSIKTKSEIVVPISRDERMLGEIDIDSHMPNAFSMTDESELTQYAAELARLF
jgi:L-methionine (R)-S-oxide reductase